MSSPSARRASRAGPWVPVVPEAANSPASDPLLPANDLEAPDPPNSDWMTSYLAANRWRTRQLLLAADSDPTGLAEAALNRERELQGLPPYRSRRSTLHPWPLLALVLLALSLVVVVRVARDIAPGRPEPSYPAEPAPASSAGEPRHIDLPPMFDGFLPLPDEKP